MQQALLVISFLLSPLTMAQTSQVQEIQTAFNRLSDLSRAESFKAILGKKYSCTEIEHNAYKDKYETFTTEINFETKISSYYGNSTDPDYLQYASYRRTNAEKFAQVPRFGCDGIEWGVAYLKDAPYLHMSNLYTETGNSNLGPCYNLKFRVQNNGSLFAVGIYNNKAVHLLKCNPK